MIGRCLLDCFIAKPAFSRMRAKYQTSPKSKKDIAPFIQKYNIDMTEYDIDQFQSFNDFFIRQKKVFDKTASNELMAIADSKLSCYSITDDLRLNIKQSNYSISDILNDNELAQRFSGGTCLVFRLAVNDYHRYQYIDDGELIFNKKIPGELHTVRAISQDYNIYTRNSREVSILRTRTLGDVAYVEVGALLVGKISNNYKTPFVKCDEKGYFEFGGSTVVVLLNKNIQLDDDIVAYCNQGYEIAVKAGERIGLIC